MLNLNDIKVLRDALNMWVDKGEENMMVGHLVTSLMASAIDDESAEKEVEKHHEQRKMEFESEREKRKMIAEDIEEKLILIRRKIKESNGSDGSDMERMMDIEELID